MKLRVLISLFLFAVVAPSTLSAKPTAEFLELSPGQVVRIDFQAPKPGQPTFLMWPGVNRGLSLEEPAALALSKAGYGVASFNFSVQPMSLVGLGQDVRPAFYQKEVTLSTLAKEATLVQRWVRAQASVTRVIPVSLSYTGAVSFFMKSEEMIADVSPMTSMAAHNPQLETYRQMLKGGELFNPIFGPAITRQMLDQAYFTVWAPQVEAITRQFALPQDRRSQMIDGYTQLSRASEGFDWITEAGEPRNSRVFVLAEKEAPVLQRHQLQTILSRRAKGIQDKVVWVEGAGHVIPADRPTAYAEILASLADRSLPDVTLVPNDQKEAIELNGRPALSWLESQISLGQSGR
ncbi:MAG: hypothetical protein AB7F86_17530 [Bdellovibrionales bacterium]